MICARIGVAGFEPAHHGIKTRCLTAWLYPNMVEGSGFEPPNPKERIYSPPRLARLRYPSIFLEYVHHISDLIIIHVF